MEIHILISEVCRLYVLIALLLAASGKSMGFSRFREDLLQSFPGFGSAGALIVAALILSAEWLIAGLLLCGTSTAQVGLAAALALFVAFATAISWSLIRENPIVCSCFGSSSHRASVHDVTRNLLLVGASGFSFAYPQLNSSLNWNSTVSLIAAATILFLLSTSLQDIMFLLRIKPNK